MSFNQNEDLATICTIATVQRGCIVQQDQDALHNILFS